MLHYCTIQKPLKYSALNYQYFKGIVLLLNLLNKRQNLTQTLRSLLVLAVYAKELVYWKNNLLIIKLSALEHNNFQTFRILDKLDYRYYYAYS